MGRKSTLDFMPDDVREALNSLLADRSLTQKEIRDQLNVILRDMGEEPVITERIVNRYAATFNDLMAKKRESNEVVKSWIGQLGDIPDGDFGRAIVEILRTLSFDMSLHAHRAFESVDSESLPGSVKMLKDLAFAVEKLEKAASENEKRDVQIKQQARLEAAETVVKTAKAAGVSAQTIERIRADVLGMAA